jgi:hypothetical protein
MVVVNISLLVSINPPFQISTSKEYFNYNLWGRRYILFLRAWDISLS